MENADLPAYSGGPKISKYVLSNRLSSSVWLIAELLSQRGRTIQEVSSSRSAANFLRRELAD